MRTGREPNAREAKEYTEPCERVVHDFGLSRRGFVQALGAGLLVTVSAVSAQAQQRCRRHSRGARDVGQCEWRDKNGDSLPQLDEYRLYTKQETKPFWRTASPHNCRFRAYTPSGQRLFSIGRGTSGFWDKPGEEISFCMQMTAPVGDFVFLTDTPGAVHAFTRDGLYAGTLCEAGDWAPELLGKDPRIQPMGEMWYAHLFRQGLGARKPR